MWRCNHAGTMREMSIGEMPYSLLTIVLNTPLFSENPGISTILERLGRF